MTDDKLVCERDEGLVGLLRDADEGLGKLLLNTRRRRQDQKRCLRVTRDLYIAGGDSRERPRVRSVINEEQGRRS